MITYKSKSEIAKIQQGGKILNALLKKLAGMVKPGISALELEKFADHEIKTAGAKPAFLNYKTGIKQFYPNILCVSVNQEVVHALPNKNKIFQNGDLVSIDCGIWYQNLCTDAAITVGCGKITQKNKKLLDTTKQALKIAISKCQINNFIGDIGKAVQKYVEAQGFCVIKDLVGHGVGYKPHEDPQIPNYFPFDFQKPKNQGAVLKPGMILALEPMVSVSAETTKLGSDGFAAITVDNSLAAHFEDTVIITKQGPKIAT